MARVICPSCTKAGNIPDRYLGNRIKCPSCRERFTAPTLPPPKSQPIPARHATESITLEQPIDVRVEGDDPIDVTSWLAPKPRPVAPAPVLAPEPPAPAAPVKSQTKLCL